MFTMKDQSTEPYAWMIEAVSLDSISKMGVENYVKAMAEQSIDGMGFEITVDEWIASGYEYEDAVRYIRQQIDEQ